MDKLIIEAYGRAARLLLVEDDPDDALLAEDELAAAGVLNGLEVAKDGWAALAALRKARMRPDLVLLDLNLPGLSGGDLLAAIRADKRLVRAKVVILTGFEGEGAFLEAEGVAADAFLPKPLGFARLAQTLSGWDGFRLRSAAGRGARANKAAAAHAR